MCRAVRRSPRRRRPLCNPPPLPPATPPPAPVYEDAPEEQETEIILKDRRRVSGKLVEVTSESVVLAISGIPTVFKLDNIEAIRELPSVEERYEGLRAAIANDDIEGLLRLAEWTCQRGRLALALKDVESVLALEPANRAANELKTIIVEQQKLNTLKSCRNQRPHRSPSPTAQRPPKPRTPSPPSPSAPRPTPSRSSPTTRSTSSASSRPTSKTRPR